MSESLVWHWMWPVVAGPFVGSFLGVLIVRWPAGGSVLRPRSACPQCGRRLDVRDLVPLLTWLAARGRCRHCGAPVGRLYPAIEAAAAAVAAWAAAVLPAGPLLWAGCGLGWTLLALAVIDFRQMLLPDRLTLPLIAAGVAVQLALASASAIDHVIGAAAGFGALWAIARLYRRFRGRDGLGLGDAKLAAAGGAWVSWAGLPSVVFLAAMIGLAVAAARAGLGRPMAADQQLPFGPPLCLAIWTVWLHGPLVLG